MCAEYCSIARHSTTQADYLIGPVIARLYTAATDANYDVSCLRSNKQSASFVGAAAAAAVEILPVHIHIQTHIHLSFSH